MYGIIYLTVCSDESIECYGKKYIGQHRTVTSIDDGYRGSGKLIRRYLDKYGYDKFSRTTLRVCESQEDLDYYERYYISLYRETDSDNLLNLHEGGSGGWSYYNNSVHDHPRGMLGKPQSEYQKKSQSERMMHNTIAIGSKGRKGKYHSEESKLKMSLSRKGKSPWCKGLTMSPEFCSRISETAKKRYLDRPELRESLSKNKSDRNSKSVWITDGTINKFILRSDSLEDYPGFYLGRTISNHTKIGKVFINNGVQNKQISSSDSIPDGWERGMLKKSGWKKGGVVK